MSQLVLVTGDHQAPFNDWNLHDLTCQWIKKNKPNKIIVLGDLLDLPGLSHFQKDPSSPTATVQECITAGHKILADYAKYAPLSERILMEGNHEKRLAMKIANDPHLSELTGLVTIPGLLGSAELGYEWLGQYPHDKVILTDRLAVMHGWIARKGAGASALAHLQTLRHSIIVGHTHRLGNVHFTQWEMDGSDSIHMAAENGTQCDPKMLKFVVAPDWQRGFTTAVIHDSGLFKVEQGGYVNKALLWRDQIFQ